MGWAEQSLLALFTGNKVAFDPAPPTIQAGVTQEGGT
jgi:hypothetical protein